MAMMPGTAYSFNSVPIRLVPNSVGITPDVILFRLVGHLYVEGERGECVDAS